MMEVVIVDDGNRLTVYELVERVIPCIIAKHYSENYIQGFRSTFRNLLAYCNKNEKKYFSKMYKFYMTNYALVWCVILYSSKYV